MSPVVVLLVKPQARTAPALTPPAALEPARPFPPPQPVVAIAPALVLQAELLRLFLGSSLPWPLLSSCFGGLPWPCRLLSLVACLLPGARRPCSRHCCRRWPWLWPLLRAWLPVIGYICRVLGARLSSPGTSPTSNSTSALRCRSSRRTSPLHSAVACTCHSPPASRLLEVEGSDGVCPMSAPTLCECTAMKSGLGTSPK